MHPNFWSHFWGQRSCILFVGNYGSEWVAQITTCIISSSADFRFAPAAEADFPSFELLELDSFLLFSFSGFSVFWSMFAEALVSLFWK